MFPYYSTACLLRAHFAKSSVRIDCLFHSSSGVLTLSFDPFFTSDRLIESTMSLSFQFKIDSIEAKEDAPKLAFASGSYKPPTQRQHYKLLETTGWRQWAPNTVSQAMSTPSPIRYSYSTSIFYDGVSTNRFLFYPGNCLTQNISNIEAAHGERWGWQHLCFSERDNNHSILDHDGEFGSLCGQAGSYAEYFLPKCYYESVDNPDRCGLSGKMSLLLALTAFSCKREYMLPAIKHRLNISHRRWENFQLQAWGNGRMVTFMQSWSYALTC